MASPRISYRLVVLYALLSVCCVCSAFATETARPTATPVADGRKPATEEDEVGPLFPDWDPEPTFQYLSQREPANAKPSLVELADDERISVHVVAIDSNFPAGELGGLQGGLEEGQPRVSQMPTAEERDQLLEKAGLTPHVKKMDHLDRDLLLIKARTNTREKLVKKYPKIPADLLSKLQELVKGGE